MKDLNNFSNFFIFICGVYFGGFTWLGYLDNDPLKKYQARLHENKEYLKIVRRETRAYTSFNVNIRLALLFFPYTILEVLTNVFFKLSSSYIFKIGSAKKDFLNRFFPSFIFNGFFCVWIVLLGAYEASTLPVDINNLVNRFLFYSACMALLLHLWTIGIFPMLVNRYSYNNLIFITICIVISCVGITVNESFSTTNQLNLNWFLNTNIGITTIIIVAITPILLVLLNLFFGIFVVQFFSFLTDILYKLIKRQINISVDDDIKSIKG